MIPNRVLISYINMDNRKLHLKVVHFIQKNLLFRTKSLRTPSNLLVVNLAIFDLTMMLDMPMLIVNSFYQRPVGWKLGCDLYALFGSISGMGSSINNAVIAYDRYRSHHKHFLVLYFIAGN